MGQVIVLSLTFIQRGASKESSFLNNRGDHGRLGHGDMVSIGLPKLVSSLRGLIITSISSGGGHNVALTRMYLFQMGANTDWSRGK